MSAAMTYTSLVSDIITYCERDDDPFVTQVDRFIMMAENRLASESKLLGTLRTVTGTLTSNIFVKPSRWRKTRNMCLVVGAERRYLYQRGYEYCRSYWPDTSLTDVPLYYADVDYEHLYVAPTPNMNYLFEMQYYERPEPLSSVNQTNWNTQYAPQMLLYAALMEAMPFLKTSERIPEFQTLYERSLAAITKEDQERLVDSAAIRS